MFEATIERLREKQASLRADTHGFNTGAVIALVVGLVISILVALALLPSIAGAEYIAAGNASLKAIPTAISMLPLTVVLVVVTVVVMPIGALLYMLRD